MPQKTLSCMCGNTELEKIGVNLLRSNDSESLELVALLCRGDGCGRVTFRPGEPRAPTAAKLDLNGSQPTAATDMPKAKQSAATNSQQPLKEFIATFEQVYTERLVYKAIAERDPGCAALVQALKADSKIRERIARSFAPVYECVERDQDLVKLVESLPRVGTPSG
ncbi:MAG: hypothetical protein JOZ44_08800 [Acidobacteria bacterium]|nr:hypothetical protein [Acidobacteriota bacterium]